MFMKNKILYLFLGFLIGVIAVSCNKTEQQGKKVSFICHWKLNHYLKNTHYGNKT